MRMMARIFVSDVRHITSNIVSIIIVIGLTVIPGLFTWFNVAACWDPFANTGNLQFAIANEDEGYKSDLLPVRVDIGDQVISTLRANSQLDWNFTKTSQEAIEGTKSGEYYAAVVIPKDFSKTMMTFFTNDAEHATLNYYTNEKLNALAPKVTGQGADTIAAQINETFAKTLTDTALGIASSLVDELDKPEAQGRLKDFNANVAELASTLDGSATTLRAYGGLTDSAQTLLDGSRRLVAQAGDSVADAKGEMSDAKAAVDDLTGALDASVAALGTAIDSSASGFDALSGRIDTLLDSVDGQANSAVVAIRDQSSNIAAEGKAYGDVRDRLQQLLDGSSLAQDSAARRGIQTLIGRIDAASKTMTQLAANLDQAAADITSHVDDGGETRRSIKDLAAQAQAQVGGLSADFDSTIKPDLTRMNAAFTSAAQQMDASVTGLKDSLGDLDGASDDAKTQLDKVRALIDGSADDLAAAGKRLTDFSGELAKALNTGDMGMVKQVLGGNSAALATTLSAPVELRQKALFPVENFGAALTPFYTFLPLWVGALLLVVALKTSLSSKRQRELGDPKPWQEFLGHYGVFAVIALMQSTFSCAGTLLFLRVQTVHPMLFMLTGWFSSIVYSFFTYTLVASFGNVGKAIGVLFLVMQISGSDAAYPLAILPKFVGDVSPFLPLTYSVTALRGAIGGIYQNDYWIAMGKLAAFLVPLLFIGLVLRRVMMRFNAWYVAKVESTKLLG